MDKVKHRPNQTVEEMQKPPTLDELTPHWKLQLVMLGALIANKDLRKQVEADDFTDENIRHAVEDLKGEGIGFVALKNALHEMQVDWDVPATGGPLEPMVKRLKLDAEYNLALIALNSLFYGTHKRDSKAMEVVVEIARRLEAEGAEGTD